MTPQQEANVLVHNLWGYDDTDYRVLRNRMVTTRAKHACDICFGGIAPGSRVRASTEVYDGICKTFRVCPECCEAILNDQHDGDCNHMEARTQLGMKRAARRLEGER